MAEKRILILATSLDDDSRSRATARRAEQLLRAHPNVSVEFVDLREHPLPFCGAEGCHDNAYSKILRDKTRAATHILFAVPVYNYDVNAAAKNYVELMGKDALADKTVAFICAAGGPRSFMSVMPFANSLMLDFRCWVVPRFVYVTGKEIIDGKIVSPDIEHRIKELVDALLTR